MSEYTHIQAPVPLAHGLDSSQCGGLSQHHAGRSVPLGQSVSDCNFGTSHVPVTHFSNSQGHGGVTDFHQGQGSGNALGHEHSNIPSKNTLTGVGGLGEFHAANDRRAKAEPASK